MLKRLLIIFASFLLLLAIWEAACLWGEVPGYILPAPSKIATALAEDFAILMQHSTVTLVESVLGMLLSAALAVFLALFMDLNDTLREVFQALLVITQCIPALVLAPLLMIWLGFGLAPKIVVVVLMCFYPITVNFASGLQAIDGESLELLQSFSASTAQIYKLAKIPAALPYLFSGLRVAATYSISAAVIGEWLSSKAGLGYYMIRVSKAYQLDKVFASLFLIIFWSLVMNLLMLLLRKIFEPGCGWLAHFKHKRQEARLQLVKKGNHNS